ncbi:ComEA family DNA-binding protein [Aequoribacter fuscus]|nr:ComEA family DNA-binding protein [Aequoribacter fuscus]
MMNRMLSLNVSRAFLALLTVAAMSLTALPLLAQDSEPQVAEVTQVDLNSADAETLATVMKGVGISKARAIVSYRTQYGPFASLDELTEVKGIGVSILERNRDRLVLR